MKVFNIQEIEHRELSSPRNKEKFSGSAVLSDILGFTDIFVHHENLLPNRRIASPHKHSDREEMFLVLKGNPTAHKGDESVELKPGDFIGFNKSSNELHFIENNTTKLVSLLAVCSNPETDHVSYD